MASPHYPAEPDLKITPASEEEKDQGLGTAAIAQIILAVFLVLILIAGLAIAGLVMYARHNRQQHMPFDVFQLQASPRRQHQPQHYANTSSSASSDVMGGTIYIDDDTY